MQARNSAIVKIVAECNKDTVESRFLEPPGETQIASRNREFENRRWHQITHNNNWPGIV